MRYKAIRKLMIQGHFETASEHLLRVLEKKPNDREALDLENTCRKMLDIIHSFEADPVDCTEISAANYFSARFKQLLGALCRQIIAVLDKLPESYRQKLGREYFVRCGGKFAGGDDGQQDWRLESLFWDSRRRRTLFIALGTLILAGIVFMIGIGLSNSSSSPELSTLRISSIIEKANDGDHESQYRLGMCFYRGIGVPADIEQSYLWLSRAAKAGHKEAGDFLQRVTFELETRQRVKDESSPKSSEPRSWILNR